MVRSAEIGRLWTAALGPETNRQKRCGSARPTRRISPLSIRAMTPPWPPSPRRPGAVLRSGRVWRTPRQDGSLMTRAERLANLRTQAPRPYVPRSREQNERRGSFSTIREQTCACGRFTRSPARDARMARTRSTSFRYCWSGSTRIRTSGYDGRPSPCWRTTGRPTRAFAPAAWSRAGICSCHLMLRGTERAAVQADLNLERGQGHGASDFGRDDGRNRRRLCRLPDRHAHQQTMEDGRLEPSRFEEPARAD